MPSERQPAERSWRLPKPLLRGLQLLPCGLLVAVALQQFALVRSADLSPWRGGGFAMFSTTDVGGNRHVHVIARHAGFEQELFAPPELAELERRARALPSESNLRTLARALAPLAPSDYGAPQSLVVQVWKTRFDPDSLIPSSSLLRTLELPLESD